MSDILYYKLDESKKRALRRCGYRHSDQRDDERTLARIAVCDLEFQSEITLCCKLLKKQGKIVAGCQGRFPQLVVDRGVSPDRSA